MRSSRLAKSEVEAAIRRIRRAVAQGRAVHRRIARSGRRDPEFLAAIGEQRGLRPSAVQRRLRLADPRRGYPDAELHRLFAGMRRTGHAIDVTHLAAAVGRADREELLLGPSTAGGACRGCARR